jgi:glutathione peroxidase-family protein
MKMTTVYDFNVKDREGKVVARFEPTVDMEEVKKAVAAAL